MTLDIQCIWRSFSAILSCVMNVVFNVAHFLMVDIVVMATFSAAESGALLMLSSHINVTPENLPSARRPQTHNVSRLVEDTITGVNVEVRI